jgi:hypothetical protein
MLQLTSADELPAALVKAIVEAELEGVHEASHCARRHPWWAIDPGRAPDAFLAYMTTKTKGIVSNDTDSHSLNGVHRITWKISGANHYLLSTWTSLWALAVEQTARHHAGGLLKLEPGAAPSLPVVLHEDVAMLERVDEILREKGLRAAREVADQAVLGQTLGFSRGQIKAVQAAVLALIERRSLPVRSEL